MSEGKILTSFEYFNQISIAADFVLKHLGSAPVAIVLGSGLSKFADALSDVKVLQYEEIPFMPCPSVVGHAGKIVWGEMENKNGTIPVICFAGRVHGYEGHSQHILNFQVRLAHRIGVGLFILTNSAGGGLPGMTLGCVMVIRDVKNYVSSAPLLHSHEDPRFGPRHLDTSKVFSGRVAKVAKDAAEKLNMKIFEGTYCMMTGPTYETPSEVRMGMIFGGGAFGMSTVPEALAASALGMEVFAMSMITNLAAGLSDVPLDHSDVTSTAKTGGPAFQELLLQIIRQVDVVEQSTLNEILPGSHPSIVYKSPSQLPTLEQILQAAQTLRKINVGQPDPCVAIFLCEGHDQFVNSFTLDGNYVNVRSLPLSDIPNFGQLSQTTSARFGQIVLGTIENTRICAVVHQNLEGFSSAEASFLVQVLAVIGVRNVLATLNSHVSLTDKKPEIVILNDTLDRGEGFLPAPPSNSQYRDWIRGNSQRSSKYAFDEDLIGDAQLQDGDGACQTGSYASYLGPSLPTSAELELAKHANCLQAGITSLSPVNMARNLGMKVFGASLNSTSENGVEKLNLMLQKVITSGHLLGSNPYSLEAEEKNAPPTPPSAEKSSVELKVDAQPETCEYDKAHEASEYLKAAFSEPKSASKPLTCIFAASSLSTACPEIEGGQTVDLKNVPNWNDVTNQQSPWQITQGTRDGNTVLCVTSEQKENEEFVPTFQGLAFLVRVLKQYGVSSVIFLVPLCSCDEKHKIGDMISITDHMNLTGKNPLYGPNEDRWGLRFTDMSNVYTKSRLGEISSAAESLNVPIASSIVASLNNPSLDSCTFGRLAKHSNASTLVCGMVPEVIISRHMGFDICAIGIVTRSVATSSDSPAELVTQDSPSQENLLQLKSIVSSIC